MFFDVPAIYGFSVQRRRYVSSAVNYEDMASVRPDGYSVVPKSAIIFSKHRVARAFNLQTNTKDGAINTYQNVTTAMWCRCRSCDAEANAGNTGPGTNGPRYHDQTRAVRSRCRLSSPR